MIKRKGTILALVLALAMVVTSVSVFATTETWSPSGKSIGEITVSNVTGVYNGQKQKGSGIVVKDTEKNVIPTKWYTVESTETQYAAAGVYKLTITVSGTGGFTDSASKTYDYTITEGSCSGHNYQLTDVITNPGCTTAGKGLYTCLNCGASYQAEVAATGHNIVKVGKTNSTCQKVGYKAHYECSHCHQFFEQKTVTTKVGKKKVKQKTWKACSTKKYTVKKKKHSYTKKTTQYLKKAATCKSAAIYYKSCKYCGQKGKTTFKSGKKAPHNYVEYIDKKGNVRHKCTVCKKTTK